MAQCDGKIQEMEWREKNKLFQVFISEAGASVDAPAFFTVHIYYLPTFGNFGLGQDTNTQESQH